MRRGEVILRWNLGDHAACLLWLPDRLRSMFVATQSVLQRDSMGLERDAQSQACRWYGKFSLTWFEKSLGMQSRLVCTWIQDELVKAKRNYKHPQLDSIIECGRSSREEGCINHDYQAPCSCCNYPPRKAWVASQEKLPDPKTRVWLYELEIDYHTSHAEHNFAEKAPERDWTHKVCATWTTSKAGARLVVPKDLLVPGTWALCLIFLGLPYYLFSKPRIGKAG